MTGDWLLCLVKESMRGFCVEFVRTCCVNWWLYCCSTDDALMV